MTVQCVISLHNACFDFDLNTFHYSVTHRSVNGTSTMVLFRLFAVNYCWKTKKLYQERISTRFSIGLFRPAHKLEGVKRPPLPKMSHVCAIMITLGIVMPYQKKFQET